MADRLIAGRYRLDSLLGRGGMSEVWHATDVELGRPVALKLLAPNEDIARFEHEARTFAALGHPHVTQVYDYGEADGRPFMVLEYVPGGTLEDRLRNGPLADEQAWTIAADVAAGLAHAHGRGVVHRDLKPSNVLFDEEGRAKLADFGIARMAALGTTLTEAGTVLGTAAYISPEQAQGAPTGPTSDVYSFGVLLYRMLTGRLPFESDDPATLLLQHRDAAPPPVHDVRPGAPAALAGLADAALAKDPALRPPDGSALLDALDTGIAALQASAAVPVVETTPTTVLPAVPPAVPPPRRRRRFGGALALSLLLLLALAGGLLAYEVTRPPADSPAASLPSSTASTRPSTSTTRRTTTTARTTASTSSTPVTTSTTVPTTTSPQTTAHATTTLRLTTTLAPPTTTEPPTTDTIPPTTDTTPTTAAIPTTAASPTT
jgi:eukaryotic-like serine/threonine-protein kinase